MLSDHVCPVCPVCNVSVLWPNGWMNQDETWHTGRPRPWPHCVVRRSSSPRKGDTAAPPLFGPCLLWPRSPILATAELLFAQLTAECPYTLQWAVPFLLQNCPFPWGIWTNAWFLGPTRAQNPNGISTVHPFFCRAYHCDDRPTDRQADRSRYSVCNNGPHPADATMRPNNNNRPNNMII